MTIDNCPRVASAPRLLSISSLSLVSLAAVSCSSSDGPAPDPAPQFAAVSGFNSSVGSIVSAGDGTGDLFFSGDFTHFGDSIAHGLLRLNSDLTIDSAFMSPQEPLNGDISVLESTGDGTVFVAGSFDGIGLDSLPGFGRILPDGSVDPSFTPPTFNGSIQAMSMAPDGSGDVFVGGNFSTVTPGTLLFGGGSSSPRLERLTSTGEVSASFDIGTGFDGAVRVIVPVPDMSGDIYVGGDFLNFNGVTSSKLIRLNADGSRDTTLALGTGFNGNVHAVQPLLDGSGDVWVGGSFTTYQNTAYPKIALLNADGSVDTGFLPAVSAISGTVESIELVSSTGSDVIVSGTFGEFGLEVRDGMAVLSADGTLSSDFTAGQTGSAGGVSTVVVRENADPSILVGGSFESFGGAGSIGFVGLSSTGEVMTSFGSGTNGDVYELLTVPGGETYVLGDFNTFDGQEVQSMMRLSPNGSLDTSFNLPEFDYIDVYRPTMTDGPNGALYAMVYIEDYGDNRASGGPRGYADEVVRFNRDGSFDENFALTPYLPFQPNHLTAVNDGSGDLYVSGGQNLAEGFQAIEVARINGDGSLDTTFQMASTFNGSVYGMTTANDGSGDLFVYGELFEDFNRGGYSAGVLRLNPDGTDDETFDTGLGVDNEVEHLVCTTDGSGDLYLVGDFWTYDNTNAAGMVRIEADGSVDEGFVPPSDRDDSPESVLMTTDGSGDVILVGEFDSWNYIPTTEGLVRINAAGAIVTSGMPETTVANNSDIYAISPRKDGSGGYYLGGDFTSFANRAAQNLVMLSSSWAAE